MVLELGNNLGNLLGNKWGNKWGNMLGKMLAAPKDSMKGLTTGQSLDWNSGQSLGLH